MAVDISTIKTAENDIIFSLDIGTRTVVGIVGVQEEDKLKIITSHVIEHKSRAMMDGQIQDVHKVTQVVKEMKDYLEAEIGFPLKQVAIAAAGRVLKTYEVRVEKNLEEGKEITKEITETLEMEGIQLAQMKLDEEMGSDDRIQFYCVGYSVINYYLNGFVISALEGHKGKVAGADILATFLPHVVVDSLYTVMNKVGLEVISLTLEPIAAINVTIPKDLRLLNLALVDIGAGTSDIAITKDGTVIAYGMAPVAGDEITERIAQHYLVDFNTAEKIKTSLGQKSSKIAFKDILGKKYSVSPAEVKDVIKDTVGHLAGVISEKIMEFNKKAPNAVFLIGGGSQVPGLVEAIAGILELPKDRVAVRGRDAIHNIKYSGKKLAGPESITPIGIAVTAMMQRGNDFLKVTVNDKEIRLFNSRKLSVADALVLIGYESSHLIGRSGKSLSFRVNGQERILRGGHGKPAEIYVNGEPSNIGRILESGDRITVQPAEDGLTAIARLDEYVDRKLFADKSVEVLVNGKAEEESYQIQEGDVITVEEHVFKVEEQPKINAGNSFVTDAEAAALENLKILQVDISSSIQEISQAESALDNLETALAGIDENPNDTPNDTTNNNNTQSATSQDTTTSQETTTQDEMSLDNSIKVYVNGQTVTIKADKSQYIFVDVFNFVDFDLSKPQGNIVLKLNGMQAAFTDVIHSGDNIDIYWDKPLSQI